MHEGRLRKIGRINVLELGGSYREMGRQYGRLFRDQLNRFYKTAIDGYFIKKEGFSYLKLLLFAQMLFRSYPTEFKEMLKGINETSRMGLSKLVLIDQINAIELVRNQKVGRCSNICVWAEYAEGGKLIFGRNFDQPEYFKNFNEFMTLAIFNPDGRIPVASIGYAGQIGIGTAINKSGVLIANNEAPVGKGDVIDTRAPNILLSQLNILARSEDLESFDGFVRQTRANCPIIVSAADKDDACTYEWTASDIRRRSGDGLMLATNHFTDPSWRRSPPGPNAYGMTEERLANLKTLAEDNRGMFNPEKMKAALDTPLEKGGATDRARTILQMVAVPEDLYLYVKAPGFQDWTGIDMKALFGIGESAGDFKLSVEKV